MSRHASRERALQTLCQMDVNEMGAEKAVDYTKDMLGDVDYDIPFYRALLNGVLSDRETIDRVINQYSEDWQLERMPGVDRNILRIAIFELVYERELPHAVVMDEAVELSKEYGTERSAKFINGVLAGILKDIGPLREQAQRLTE